ncbi:WGR domain-containing protein [Hydrogenophaga taeniospiralis]|uniref:WGR domain-containing protein n=1 Tax=Hydrogenophaga taeniospiralis TaxID=65656 RepID=UPI001CFAB69A|nr:WGR domain-containing protein [Hydrogenophaga taeniospiralis]UCU92318.1 WGR domain-containing protein [Hydrogenophaga taeniospiralis]
MKNFQHYGVKSAKGGGKFWELSVVGASLIEREGKIGDKGKQKKTDCADTPTAHAQADRLLTEKKAAGFLMFPVKPLPDTKVAKSDAAAEARSAVHAPAPEEWLALQKQFHHICEGINERYREELIDALGPRFKGGAWAWDPVYEGRPQHEIDRLGDVVMGPLFTSHSYEWPYRDGLPMAPLIQLDLERASQRGGVALGDGLVQVWMPHKALAGELQYVRVVPRTSVDRSDLTPVPAMPPELDPLQSLDGVWNEELGRSVLAPAFQIVAWGDMRYTTTLAQGMQSYYKLKRLTSDPALAKEIDAFDKALAALVQTPSARFSSVNAHLFGTFSEIQYAPQDRPQPLFCFDGEDFGLVWGDGGNAQLFYTLGEGGEVTFSFDWSSH